MFIIHLIKLEVLMLLFFFFAANQVRKIPTFTNYVICSVAERNVTHILIIPDRHYEEPITKRNKYCYDVNMNGLIILLTLASNRILGLFWHINFTCSFVFSSTRPDSILASKRGFWPLEVF